MRLNWCYAIPITTPWSRWTTDETIIFFILSVLFERISLLTYNKIERLMKMNVKEELPSNCQKLRSTSFFILFLFFWTTLYQRRFVGIKLGKLVYPIYINFTQSHLVFLHSLQPMKTIIAAPPLDTKKSEKNIHCSKGRFYLHLP